MAEMEEEEGLEGVEGGAGAPGYSAADGGVPGDGPQTVVRYAAPVHRPPTPPPQSSSPYAHLRELTLSPRVKAAVQIGITALLITALVAAYHITEKWVRSVPVHDASPHPNEQLPGWTYFVFPLVALVPAAYFYIFLKHYYNQ